MKKIKLSLISFVFLAGCSSSSVDNTPGEHTFEHGMSDGKFNDILETFTQKDEQYAGFVAAYQMNATIQNATVSEAQLLRQAEDFKWSRENYFKEKEKSSQEISNESQVFVGFYAPVHENEKLDTGKSIWNCLLYTSDAADE